MTESEQESAHVPLRTTRKPLRRMKTRGVLLFRGPMNLWPWPLINLILMLTGTLTVCHVDRDEEGNILSIEEYER